MERFKDKITWIVLLGVLATSMIVGGYIGANYFPKKKTIYKNRTKIDTLSMVDTVYKTIEIPKVKIRTKAIVKYKTDTVIIRTNPFVAEVDTVFKETEDTLGVKFSFPSFVFDINMNYKPRKEKIIYKYISITDQIEKEEAWYVHPAWTTGGLVLGYLFGSIK